MTNAIRPLKWVLLFLLCGGASVRFARAADSVEPTIILKETDWNGVQKRVAAHKGRIVVINIWTTTCPGCLAKFPEFLKLKKTYQQQIVLISVNCDYDGVAGKSPKFYRPDVTNFLKKQKATGEHILLTTPFITFLDQIKLSSTPAILVYDASGKLAKRFDNDHTVKESEEFTMQQVEQYVGTLVKKKPSSNSSH